MQDFSYHIERTSDELELHFQQQNKERHLLKAKTTTKIDCQNFIEYQLINGYRGCQGLFISLFCIRPDYFELLYK